MKAIHSSELSVGCRWLGFALAVLLSSPAGAAESSASPSAADLAGRLSALRQDGSSLIRLRMEINGASKTTYQLLIKERRTRDSSDVAYQVLWPKERKGETILLSKSGSRVPSGTHFTPPNTVKSIDAGQMKDALLGSDLAYEDIVENFYAWDQQAIVGQETVDGVPCQILESKPGKGDRSIYGSVRSWVDTRRMIPLRVEKFASSGQSVRRFDTTRVATIEGRVIPANITIRTAGQGSYTFLDGSRIKHDVTFKDREFTIEGAKEPAAPPAE